MKDRQKVCFENICHTLVPPPSPRTTYNIHPPGGAPLKIPSPPPIYTQEGKKLSHKKPSSSLMVAASVTHPRIKTCPEDRLLPPEEPLLELEVPSPPPPPPRGGHAINVKMDLKMSIKMGQLLPDTEKFQPSWPRSVKLCSRCNNHSCNVGNNSTAHTTAVQNAKNPSVAFIMFDDFFITGRTTQTARHLVFSKKRVRR